MTTMLTVCLSELDNSKSWTMDAIFWVHSKQNCDLATLAWSLMLNPRYTHTVWCTGFKFSTERFFSSWPHLPTQETEPGEANFFSTLNGFWCRAVKFGRIMYQGSGKFLRGRFTPFIQDRLATHRIFTMRHYMHKRGLCYRPVSVCLPVCHIHVLYPDGQRYR